MLAQNFCSWTLSVSDDGSTDGTLDILEQYRTSLGGDRVTVRRGPGKGFVQNFLALTCEARVEAAYFAYSDQDDVWESNKLTKATTWLESIPPSVPALYCSRTRLVDSANNHLGYSSLFKKAPTFENALVQSISGGNTLVFNQAARSLIQKAGKDVEVVSHDWWLYLAITSCGGIVFYDQEPTLRYRQHDQNLVGANIHWSAKLLRARWLMQGYLRVYNDQHILALQRLENNIDPKNFDVLQLFIKARNRPLISRIVGMLHCGIYRQTFLGNLGLIAAVLLRKI